MTDAHGAITDAIEDELDELAELRAQVSTNNECDVHCIYLDIFIHALLSALRKRKLWPANKRRTQSLEVSLLHLKDVKIDLATKRLQVCGGVCHHTGTRYPCASKCMTSRDVRLRLAQEATQVESLILPPCLKCLLAGSSPMSKECEHR